MTNLVHIVQKIAVAFKESGIDKVVILDPGKRKRPFVLCRFGDFIIVNLKPARCAFPFAPRLSTPTLFGFVLPGQSLMIGIHQITSFLHWDRRQILFPVFWKQMRRPVLVKKQELARCATCEIQ
jgi:hypothetical protein